MRAIRASLLTRVGSAAAVAVLAGGGMMAGVLAATPAGASVPHFSGAATSTKTVSGDNGTVKIHRSTTPVSDRRNQPHVCVFYLDAFAFDSAQSVSWWIKSWPPTGDRSIVSSGVLTLDANGDGHTGDMTLANGHYKLFWTFAGEHGIAKHKVFWVNCKATPTPTPSPSPSTSSPVS